MSEGPETRLVKAIRDYITKHYPDAWFFKVHGSPYQTAGTPDVLVCVGGHLFAMEAKAQRQRESVAAALGRVSLVQQIQLKRLLRAGATVGVVLSVEDAAGLLEGRWSGSEGAWHVSQGSA